eukprot:1161467-Pelagomonas_calceolata.AAC.5
MELPWQGRKMKPAKTGQSHEGDVILWLGRSVPYMGGQTKTAETRTQACRAFKEKKVNRRGGQAKSMA